MAIQLILGGARSGKSAYAEKLAEQFAAVQAAPVCYIATAQVQDVEMQQRIAHHQASRPAGWQTCEVQTDLAGALFQQPQDGVVIIDCLTLWLMSCFSQYPTINQAAIDEFMAALSVFKGELYMVSNEISMGVVPMGAISRDYVDGLGRMHQQIAAMADRVTLMVAGIPMKVKG